MTSLPPIIELSSISPSESITVLMYGASGTGKTYAAGTCGSRSVLVNTGKGIETLLAPAFTNRYKQGKVVNISEDISKGYLGNVTAFDTVCRVFDNLLTLPEVDTVILDDCTSLRRYAMNKGLTLNASTGKSDSLGKSKLARVPMPAIQDFGMEMGLIQQFVSYYTEAFKDAKKNLILISHERVSFNKGKSIGDAPTVRKISPGFTGQTFPDEVPAYFDCVWHTEVRRSGKAIYQVRTSGDSILTAKTRQGGILDEIIIDPSFQVILAKLQSGGKGNGK
jgi:hypothetical protein